MRIAGTPDASPLPSGDGDHPGRRERHLNRAGRTNALDHRLGPLAIGAQDQPDPVQGGHGRREPLGVLDEVRQTRPPRGLALDNAPDQRGRLGTAGELVGVEVWSASTVLAAEMVEALVDDYARPV